MKIIENFFSKEEIQLLTKSIDIDYVAALTHYESSRLEPYTKSNLPTILKKIINLVNIDYKVVETWVHDSKFADYLSSDGLPRHSDCNEVLRDEEGILEFPEKTFVYYVQVSEDFCGGELVVYRKNTNEILAEITPRSNKLVYFDSDNEHEIKPFSGRRTSLILNPWLNPPDCRGISFSGNRSIKCPLNLADCELCPQSVEESSPFSKSPNTFGRLPPPGFI